MRGVVFDSDPRGCALYAQGIAACSNLLDLGLEVAAFPSGAFAQALEGAPDDAPFKRQFAQLELFGAKVHGDPARSAEARTALGQCEGVLCF